MAYVYILYSNSLERFYTGSCNDLSSRYKQHLNKHYHGSYTSQANDWTIFLSVEGLDKNVARKIEGHIKRMKSSTYILNLKKYPEMIEKLIEKYGEH